MIFGVTHSAEGEPIKRATIGYKLSIGLPPTEGKNYPQRLDHFIVTTKTHAKGGWEEDKAFTTLLADRYCKGQPFRELDVVLLSDDPEEVFRSEYAWRTQTQLLCHGDGRDAVRRFSQLHPDDQKDIPNGKPNDWIEIGGCGKGCPQLDQRLCKPSGDLYFMFPERPVLGSVALLHTSGYESVRRISASLLDIKNMVEEHGGSLKGLRLKLVARPYKASYMDKDQRKNSVQLGFNLEFRQEDHRKLLPALVNQSREFNKEVGDVIEVEPLNEDEAATTIGPEFHPTEEQVAEQAKAEAAVEAKKQVDAAGQRPKVLDKVAEQAPKPPAAEPTLKDKMTAAKTLIELNALSEQAKKLPKAERDALRQVYKERYAVLVPTNVPAGWKDEKKPDPPPPPVEEKKSDHPTDII